jgi:hypothetical protein
VKSLLSKLATVCSVVDKNTNIFVILLVLFCDFIDFPCEFTVKTTEYTVASYESSDFT